MTEAETEEIEGKEITITKKKKKKKYPKIQKIKQT